MIKNYLIFIVVASLLSCSGSSESSQEIDTQHVITSNETETDANEIEDKEYGLNELFDQHATLEDPDYWFGESVRIWFVLSKDLEETNALFNGENIYSFNTIVDTRHCSTNGGEISLFTSSEYYQENPDIFFKKGDTIHAKGIFDYAIFKGASVKDIEVVEL